MTTKNLHDKILDAYDKASGWLSEANRLREAGKDDSKALAKAQWWLDRLNKLEGNS